MKRYSATNALIIFCLPCTLWLALVGCVAESEGVPADVEAATGASSCTNLVGAWEQIGGRGVFADSTQEWSIDADWAPYGGRTTFADGSTREWPAEDIPEDLNKIKVLSPSRWLYAMTWGDSTRNFGGGRYTSTDSSITHWREHYMNSEMIGTSDTWKCRVEGEYWYHTNPNGSTMDPPQEITEVWRKID